MQMYTCPHLGVIDDPETRYRYPDLAHRCYATPMLAEIPPPYQSSYCLQPAFVRCSAYRGETSASAAQQGRRKLALRMLMAVGALGLLLMVFWRGLSQTRSRAASPIAPEATAEILPDTAMQMVFPNLGVVLYVPASSLTEGGFISLAPRESDLYPEAGPDWSRPRVVNLMMYDLAGDLVETPALDQPIEVCFDLNDLEWSDYLQDPGSFQVQSYDAGQGYPQWVGLPLSVRESERRLCGQTAHLTLFALAVQEDTMALLPTETPTLTPTSAPTETPPPTPRPAVYSLPPGEVTTQTFPVYFCKPVRGNQYEWYEVKVTYVNGEPVREDIVSGPHTGDWRGGCPGQ